MDNSLIDDLLDHPKVLETRSHVHHGIAKYDHIMRVARFSYRLAGLIRADVRICVRAGVLHDIDSRFGTLTNHGEVAARWAADHGEEHAVCEAIVSHMYPFGPVPTTREGWVLTLADKAASLADLSDYARGLVTGRSKKRKVELQSSDPFYRPHKKVKRSRRIRKALDLDV